MAVFSSEEQLYQVLQQVFDAVNADPSQIEPFTRSNLVIRMSFTGPDGEVLLDGRQPPLEVFFGERPGAANIECSMPADLLHEIWMDRESASAAFFSGRIKTKGNLLKAASLLDLFRAAETVYPRIATEFGLE
jgi:hypothetical protein